MEILFRDAQIAACVKPPGVLSQDQGDNCVPALLRQELGGAFFPLYRLDQAVGGVMLCARSSEAAGKWTAALAQSGEKIYYAVAAGDPGEEGTYTDLLYHDPRTNKTFPVRRMRRGVREATLQFQRLETAEYDGETLSLVQIRLETGRTHQIRVQFASRGMPLVGDRRYGSRIPAPSPALWCGSVHVARPDTGDLLRMQAPLPQTFPFSLFGSIE